MLAWRTAIKGHGVLCIAGMVAMGLVGCDDEDIVFHDNASPDFEFDLLDGDADDLHQPYVAGSTVSLYAYADDERDEPMGWSFKSLDEDVIEVLGSDGNRVDILALGPGQAKLQATPKGGPLDGEPRTLEVAVVVPDRIAMIPRAFSEWTSVDARADNMRVVTGGEALFEARYFYGDTRLYGGGILTAKNPSVEVTKEGSSATDWLLVRPESVGSETLMIGAGGTAVAELTIEGVDPAAIDGVRVVGGPGADIEDGHEVRMLAVATDDVGAVFGVEYSWELDGAPLTSGDIISYTYDEDAQAQSLTANGLGYSDSAVVRGTDFYGIDSTEIPIGCSAHTGPVRGAWPFGLLALGLVALGRRRHGRRR